MAGCSNCIGFVTNKNDMLYLLRRMLDNLEKTGWDTWTDEEKRGDIPQLTKLIGDKVNLKPAYLDALDPNHESHEYSESGYLVTMEYAPGVWMLDMRFHTKYGPAYDSIGESLNPEGLYYHRHYWKMESGGASNNEYYCFHDGNSGEPMIVPKEYEAYGEDAFAAMYCNRVAKVAPPCNEYYLKHLVNNDDGEAILRVAKEGDKANALVDALDPSYAFKRQAYNSFAAILEVKKRRFSPRKLDEYLNTLIGVGNEKALFAFIDNYDWTKKSIDSAIAILNAYADPKTAELVKERIKNVPNLIAAQMAKEFEGAYRISEGKLEVLRGTSVPDEFFKDNSEIESIYLSGGSIGSSAFENCINLKEIELADNWFSIDKRAFAGCVSLECVALAFRMISLGAELFDGCTSLKKIEIKGKQGESSLKRKAFGSVPNLEYVSITGRVRILKGAFSGCPNIKILKVSKNVTLGKGALDELSNDVVIKAPKGSEVAEYRDAQKNRDK